MLLIYLFVYLIAVARQGPIEGLNPPAFELCNIQKWTELIDESEIAQCNLHKLARV